MEFNRRLEGLQGNMNLFLDFNESKNGFSHGFLQIRFDNGTFLSSSLSLTQTSGSIAKDPNHAPYQNDAFATLVDDNGNLFKVTDFDFLNQTKTSLQNANSNALAVLSGLQQAQANNVSRVDNILEELVKSNSNEKFSGS